MMSHDTSRSVSSQTPNIHDTAVTSRMPLSEIQDPSNIIHVNAPRSQLLLQSRKPLVVELEDKVYPRARHSLVDINLSTSSQRETTRSTLRGRAKHVQPKLQMTPTLHQHNIAVLQSGHNQASPSNSPSSHSLHHKPSLPKSLPTTISCLETLTLPKHPSTFNSCHSKSHRLQITLPRSKLVPSSKPRPQGSRVRLPDPHKEPPDSYAAASWRHVKARIATMDEPSTATTPSITASSGQESNSKLDQTLEELQVDQGIQCDPNFTTIVSIKDTPAIIAKLRSEMNEGSTTLNLLAGIESVFFRRSQGFQLVTEAYDAWTIIPPTQDQLVIHINHTVDVELNTVSIAFSLAAGATWNHKFLRGYAGLLRSAKVFDTNMRCSQFLIVTAGEADLSLLHEQWIQHAEQALEKQLSVRRADAVEDRWRVLTHIRCYGYLINGLNLEIHEMVYRPDLSRQRVPIQPERFQGQSMGFSTKGPSSNTAPKSNDAMNSGSRPISKPMPAIPSGQFPTNRPSSTSTSRTPSNNVASNRPKTLSRTNSLPATKSRTTSRGSAASGSGTHREAAPQDPSYKPLTFTTSMVKSFNLECAEDIVQFSKFHNVVVKWAQVHSCAAFVKNLHHLCYEPTTEKTGLWKMTNEEMHQYWDSVAPQHEVVSNSRGPSSGALMGMGDAASVE